MNEAPEGAAVAPIPGAFLAGGNDEVGEQVVALCCMRGDQVFVGAEREDGEEGDEDGGEDASDNAFPRHAHA